MNNPTTIMVHKAYLTITLLLIFSVAIAQIQVDPSCDLFQSLAVGQTYYIYNPSYPILYRPNTRCRWIARAPDRYKVNLTCTDLTIPESPNCVEDRLSISLTGDPNFKDGHNYCGNGKLSLISTTISMSVGLFASQYSRGGKMLCELRAIVDTSPPVTTTLPPGGCDCGWTKQRRIVGGTETQVNEYPFIAGLVNTNERPAKPYCGASIIHYHYAVTAAHCMQKVTDITKVGLLVGDHNYNQSGETDAVAFYLLSGFLNHQQYNPNTKQHDIAIVRTQVDMKFSMEVGPVCLPFWYTNSQPSASSTVTVLGWGATELSGPSSAVLLAANLKVVSNSFCQSEYAGSYQIFQTQICTLEDEKDACQSDSGGPVVYWDSSRRLHLVGIISYGIGCAMDYPGVNTRVTSYLDWIITNTLDASYCRK